MLIIIFRNAQKEMEILVIDNVKSAITQGKLLTLIPEQKPVLAKV
jgi:D-3-phosphoglycerate dehydrogenase